MRGPSGSIPVDIDHRGDGTVLVCFTPRENGKNFILFQFA